jgi:Putative transposase
MYRRSAEGAPEFVEARGPTDQALQAALHEIITRTMKMLTRPALANERVQTNAAGQVVLKLKTAWRDGTTHLAMSPLEFMQRVAALVPKPRLSSPSTAASWLPIAVRGRPVGVERRDLSCRQADLHVGHFAALDFRITAGINSGGPAARPLAMEGAGALFHLLLTAVAYLACSARTTGGFLIVASVVRHWGCAFKCHAQVLSPSLASMKATRRAKASLIKSPGPAIAPFLPE